MTSTAILPITAPNTVVPAVCVLLEPLREDRLTTYALLKDLQCSWLQILLLPTLAILFDNLGVAAWVAAWVAVQVDALGINSRDWVSTALFTFLGWILITCGGLARIITGLGWQREKNRAQLVYQITDIEELEKLFLTRLGEAGLPESLTLQTDDAWIDLSQGRNRPVVLGLLLRSLRIEVQDIMENTEGYCTTRQLGDMAEKIKRVCKTFRHRADLVWSNDAVDQHMLGLRT